MKKTVCCICGGNLSGYPREKNDKHIYYYYRNKGKNGHSMNVKDEVLHNKFLELLEKYTLQSGLESKFRGALESTFHEMEQRSIDSKRKLKLRLNDTEKHIAMVTRRYALDEISKVVFDQVVKELERNKDAILSELSQIEDIGSNLFAFLDDALQICRNLNNLWQNGSLFVRRGIQKLVFPQGLIRDNNAKKFEPEICSPIF